MTASTLATPRLPPVASVALAAWLGLVLLGGATGFFAGLPFPGTQVIILGLVVATIVAGFAVPALRAWIDGLPLRALISINVFRMVGFVFLAYAARGQLAQVFADRAGWGDIAVGALALVLVAAGAPRTALHRGLTYAWNALGTLDLVTAVVTATFVGIRGPWASLSGTPGSPVGNGSGGRFIPHSPGASSVTSRSRKWTGFGQIREERG